LKFQCQVGWRLPGAHSGEELLRAAQRNIPLPAAIAGLHVTTEIAHLVAGHGSIEVGRE